MLSILSLFSVASAFLRGGLIEQVNRAAANGTPFNQSYDFSNTVLNLPQIDQWVGYSGYLRNQLKGVISGKENLDDWLLNVYELAEKKKEYYKPLSTTPLPPP